MKKVKVLLLILPLFLLTGCWNYNELNNLALVTGISIDQQDDKFIMNYMISNAKKSDTKSGNSEASTVLYEGMGETLAEASLNINQKLPQIPYLSHTEVIVISEEVAKDNMLKVMDFLLRNPESRKEIYVLISKNAKASDTLSILTPLESFPSENIKSNITSSPNEVATTYTIKYSEFLSKLITEGIDPTIGIIEVEGNTEEGKKQESNDNAKQEAIIKLTTTAIFKGDKLVNITNEDESIAINLMNGNLSNVYIKTSCDNNNSIITSLTDVYVKKSINVKDGMVSANIDVKGNGSLLEVNCNLDLEDSNTIRKIEEDVKNKVKELLNSGVNVSKSYQADILGLGNILYKYNFKYWNKVKNNWKEEYLPNLEVNINTDIKLSSKGSLEQSIEREIK